MRMMNITEQLYVQQKNIKEEIGSRLFSSRDAAEKFLNFTSENITLSDMPVNWVIKTLKILKKYNSIKIDIADVSLVILAENMSCSDILTSDRKDFSVLRWGHNNCFNNLLFI